jgi:hypothetical protein
MVKIALRLQLLLYGVLCASLVRAQETQPPHIDNCTCNKTHMSVPELRFNTLPESGSAKADVCSLAPESRRDKWVLHGVTNRMNRAISVNWKDASLLFGYFSNNGLSSHAGAGILRSGEEIKDDKSTVLLETNPQTLASTWIIEKRAHDDSREVWVCDKNDHRISAMALGATANLTSFADLPNTSTGDQIRYSLMLATGESMVVSSSLHAWVDSLKLPAGWTREDSVSVQKLGVAQPWSYRRTIVMTAIGITAGALAQASGGPKWSTAAGAGFALSFDASAQFIRRIKERRVLREWMGPAEGNNYAVLRNNSGQSLISLSQEKGRAQGSGNVLLFKAGDAVFVGTELTVP